MEKLTESQKAFRKLPKVEQLYQLIHGNLDGRIKSASRRFSKAKTQKERNAEGRVCRELVEVQISIEAMYETFFKKKTKT